MSLEANEASRRKLNLFKTIKISTKLILETQADVLRRVREEEASPGYLHYCL